MEKTRHESTQDRALTHIFSGFALALIAVCSFALGVLARDVAQDYRDEAFASLKAACDADREQAALYAKALVNLLSNRTVRLGESTLISCRVKEISS